MAYASNTPNGVAHGSWLMAHESFSPDVVADFSLRDSSWLKVIYLTEGDEIAVAKLETGSKKLDGKSADVAAEQSSANSEDLIPSSKPQVPSSEVIWDKVVSIKYVGNKQVYDIEVEGTHNFIANEILAHNTYINGNIGIGTTGPGAKLHVQGNIKAKMETDVSGNAAIWGGSTPGSVYELGYDIAELFDASEEVELGDVLVIGEDGLLAKSAMPYDTKVAGIVSAAPAILFEGSELQMAPQPFSFTKGKKPPIALVGRVLVKVTAENGPIMPGDLLTTSSVPGHAMRADEYKPGAILGKALEALEEGEGKIRALVTLQ